jgi:internalin A
LTDLSLGNNQVSEISPLSGLSNLRMLSLSSNQISDISPLSGLIGLTDLSLGNNQVSEISPLSGLIGLTLLNIGWNQIADIEPLVNNPGIGSGDTVPLWGNPLNSISIDTHIPALQARGVTVFRADSVVTLPYLT